MKSLCAALQFLTIFPLVGRVNCNQRQLGRSVFWFPMVGLMAGGTAAAVDWLAAPVLGQTVASTMAVLSLLAVSGGLHVDGLADMGDGFLSARPRERILEIMRDSRIGTMGVLAILAVFSLKCTATNGLTSDGRWQTFLLMGLLGRSSIVIQLAVMPYARSQGGLASLFVDHRSKIDVWWATLFTLGASCVLMGPACFWVLVTTALVLAMLMLWSLRKIGGFTGDTLGAGCEITELVVALSVLAIQRGGGL